MYSNESWRETKNELTNSPYNYGAGSEADQPNALSHYGRVRAVATDHAYDTGFVNSRGCIPHVSVDIKLDVSLPLKQPG